MWIYCVGTTPTPLDRFKNKRNDFSKVSLGAEESVSWEHVHDGLELIKALKKQGFHVIALEQADNSVDYKSVEVQEKTAIILGNEVDGVDQTLLKACHVIAEIPMMGEKESLNVSVAGAVFLYRLLDRAMS